MIAVDRAIVEMHGLPRQNGELVFEQPWEARAFGVAVALCREQSIDWELFRSRLIVEIGGWEHEHGSVPSDEWGYYERWAASLERLALELGPVAEPEVSARGPARACRQSRPRPSPRARPRLRRRPTPPGRSRTLGGTTSHPSGERNRAVSFAQHRPEHAAVSGATATSRHHKGRLPS